MDVCRDDLMRMVGEVWETALGLPVIPEEAAPADARPRVVGTINIRGACEAEVVVGCDPGLARKAAAMMFAVPEADVNHEQMHDAVGELTNMTGGQFKALLPEGCTLSLPTTADAPTFPADGLSFRSADLPFTVRITTP